MAEKLNINNIYNCFRTDCSEEHRLPKVDARKITAEISASAANLVAHP